MKKRRRIIAIAICVLSLGVVLGFYSQRVLEVRRWIAELESEDWAVVENALDSLVERRAKTAIPAMLELAQRAWELEDKYSDIEDTELSLTDIFFALAELVDSPETDRLFKMLESTESSERAVAVRVFGDIAWKLDRRGEVEVLERVANHVVNAALRKPESMIPWDQVELLGRLGRGSVKVLARCMARSARAMHRDERSELDEESSWESMLPHGSVPQLIDGILDGLGPFAKSRRADLDWYLRIDAENTERLSYFVGMDHIEWVKRSVSALESLRRRLGFDADSRDESEESIFNEHAYLLTEALPAHAWRGASEELRGLASKMAWVDCIDRLVSGAIEGASDPDSIVRRNLRSPLERTATLDYLFKHPELARGLNEELILAWLAPVGDAGFGDLEPLGESGELSPDCPLYLVSAQIREQVLLQSLRSSSVELCHALILLSTLPDAHEECYDRLARLFMQAVHRGHVDIGVISIVAQLGPKGQAFVPALMDLEKIDSIGSPVYPLSIGWNVDRRPPDELRFASRWARAVLEGWPEDRHSLLHALNRVDDTERASTLGHFVSSWRPHASILLRRLRDETQCTSAVANLLRRLGAEIVGPVAELAASESALTHRQAFAVLELMPIASIDLSSISVLIESEDSELRFLGLRWLAKKKDLDAAMILEAVNPSALESAIREALQRQIPLEDTRLVEVVIVRLGAWSHRFANEFAIGSAGTFDGQTYVAVASKDSLRDKIHEIDLYLLQGSEVLIREFMPEIRSFLRSTDLEVRVEASLRLLEANRSEDSVALSVLQDALSGPLSDDDMEDILFSLRDPSIDKRLLAPAVIDWIRKRRSVSEASTLLIGWGEPVVDQLVSALDEDDPVFQSWLLVTIGRIGPEASRATPELLKFLDHEAPELRAAALEAFRWIGAASPVVERRVAEIRREDAAGFVRAEAADTLAAWSRGASSSWQEVLPERDYFWCGTGPGSRPLHEKVCSRVPPVRP